MVVLDQRAQLRRGSFGPLRLVGHRVGEGLVVGQVGVPVTVELTAEPGLVRRIEQQVLDEPQDGIGHVVVGPLEGLRRDVEHPHRDVAGLRGLGRAGRQLPRCGAVRVAERRADPGDVGFRRHRRQPRAHPRDQAPAAAPAGHRAVGAELVRHRTPIRGDQNPSLHSPAGYLPRLCGSRGDPGVVPPGVTANLVPVIT